MADVEALITSVEDYADTATSEALASIDAAVSSVGELASRLVWDIGSNWDYSILNARAIEMINLLKPGTEQKPPKPDGLGVFDNLTGMPKPTGYDKPTDSLIDLLNNAHTIINIVSAMPERIVESMIMFEAVNDKIMYDLTNGGYGIDPLDEQALWQRTRDRESIVANIALEELRNQFASYSIPIPQGAYLAALEIALNKSQDAMSTVNRDISIKRADLYRTTRESTIKLSIELANAQLGITTQKITMMKDAANIMLEEIRTDIEAHKELLAVDDFNLRVILGKQDVLAKIYGSEINSWELRLIALTRAYAILQQANTDQLASDRLAFDSNINHARVQVEAFNAQVNVITAALQSKAHVLMSKVAGALSALNAVASAIEQKISNV